MEDLKKLAEAIGVNQAATLIALTLLVNAIAKQPSIDKDRLIADLLKLLPTEGEEGSQSFLAEWRKVLETSF